MEVFYCDLKGQNERTLYFEVSKIVEQDQNDILGVIEPGTPIICRSSFPMIDFFIHSELVLKLFIQLSVYSYQGQVRKLPDLFTSTVSPEYEEKRKESVLDYLYSRCGCISREESSLPNDCFFVYITALPIEKAIHRRLPDASAPVALICKEYLEPQGELWRLPALYLES